jgi:prephenate dehydratase
MEKKIKVAYQGVQGAYSHLACLNYFGSNILCLESKTFEDAMELVEDNYADFALIPIENKTAGRVDEFYGLIPNMKLQIVGEHYQKIEHCLLGVKGSSLDDITWAYSHPQGLAQCRDTLQNLRISPVAQFDTAGSAKEIANLKDKRISAIASSLAGEIYGLEILKYNIQDQKDNFTRFIVLSNRKNIEIEETKPYITSIIFQVKNVSSALYKALGGFAKNDVNILKIESYIPLQTLKESHFHIDVDGSMESKPVKKAIRELKQYVKRLKILGTYEKNPLRVF